jgi:NAD(P)-dependent dehydrogenase (short-subunit alcohol dehydrogenase family)
MACPRLETRDGFEMQIGVNHLGHFLLTHLLLDLMRAAPAARIINVSSSAHTMGGLSKKDFMSEKNYNRWFAYGQSKLANILFSRELAKKLKETRITANSCHPGIIKFILLKRKLVFSHASTHIYF